MRNRLIAASVIAAAVLGLVLGSGAANALAAPVIPNVSYTVVASASHKTNAAGMSYCTVVLLSEQITASGPPFVSGYLDNVQAGKTCAGWLERSANGGRTWTVSSSVVRAPSAGFTA